LAAFSVSPLTLVPQFSPSIHDYYVRCAAGANALTVSMEASPGASSALTMPEHSLSKPRQTLSVSVSENQAIVATATAGEAREEYWVRCLPHDFPTLSMQAHPEAGTPTPGYYITGNGGRTPGFPMVVDGNGVPVWYIETTESGVSNVDNVVDGGISFFWTWKTDPVQIQYMSPWSRSTAAPSGQELDTHELRIAPNGDYLVLSYPTVTGVDLSGLPNLALPDGGVETQMFDCQVLEFEPKTGKIVWSWVASEHFDPVKDSIVPGLSLQAGEVAADVWHCNSIDIDPANGNLLVSSRNMNSVFYIDKKTKAVLWKVGGSSYSKDNAIYVPVTKGEGGSAFIQQHDGRLQTWSETTGRGQISVFDDESDADNPARGLLLDVNTGADGTKPSASVAFQYAAEGNSVDRGSFRIYSDGTRLIGWGKNAAPGLVFTELDPKGNDVLDFSFGKNDVSYRAVKVPLADFDLGVMRKTAGLSSP
jgi:hypothetical protein